MRQCICKNCGKIYLTNKRESWYCPQCAKELKSYVGRKKVCARCGVEFIGYPRSKYCVACAPIVDAEHQRNFRRNGPARPIGSIDICENCGKEYVVNSGRQKYCPECAKVVVKENIKAQKREWNRQHQEEIKKKRAEMKKDRRVCIICGKTFSSPTPTVTCSPECAAENEHRRQARADYKRGRATVARTIKKADHPNPQSGITGITWHKNTGKWQLNISHKYYGLFETIEEAAKRKKEVLKEQEEEHEH